MSSRTDLKTVDSWSDEVALCSSVIKSLGGPLEILEAGCGLEWPINLDGIDYRLTGIDLNADALQRRVEKVGDLDEANLGDLTVKGTIPPGRYDVIYSSFVLEHIHDAEAALALMFDGLKPGGLLLLRIPDRDAAYGLDHAAHTVFGSSGLLPLLRGLPRRREARPSAVSHLPCAGHLPARHTGVLRQQRVHDCRRARAHLLRPGQRLTGPDRSGMRKSAVGLVLWCSGLAAQ
ncbi:class I SAM-dependent methyltransferase [Mycobacterium ulcerans]|uniref:class I SAM-dependent methyltransferase n=1 Tax=Mycobacterium ulcerans TaxID=1809 RepID=UPI001FFD922F|nr:class I SAM-dependent methyltransferase [Mycobacterium ulcerans]